MPNEPNNTNNMNAAEGNQASQILDRIKNLEQTISQQKEQLAQRDKMISQQQELLISSPNLNQQGAVNTAPAQDDIKTPNDLVRILGNRIEEITNTTVKTMIDSEMARIMPLIRSLSKGNEDNSAIVVAEIADKIQQENPNLSREMALEVAESRNTKSEADNKALTDQAESLALEQAADAASIGNRGNTSANTASANLPPVPPPAIGSNNILDLGTFNKEWDKAGMDVAQAERDAVVDDSWGIAPVGVTPS